MVTEGSRVPNYPIVATPQDISVGSWMHAFTTYGDKRQLMHDFSVAFRQDLDFGRRSQPGIVDMALEILSGYDLREFFDEEQTQLLQSQRLIVGQFPDRELLKNLFTKRGDWAGAAFRTILDQDITSLSPENREVAEQTKVLVLEGIHAMSMVDETRALLWITMGEERLAQGLIRVADIGSDSHNRGELAIREKAMAALHPYAADETYNRSLMKVFSQDVSTRVIGDIFGREPSRVSGDNGHSVHLVEAARHHLAVAFRDLADASDLRPELLKLLQSEEVAKGISKYLGRESGLRGRGQYIAEGQYEASRALLLQVLSGLLKDNELGDQALEVISTIYYDAIAATAAREIPYHDYVNDAHWIGPYRRATAEADEIVALVKEKGKAE